MKVTLLAPAYDEEEVIAPFLETALARIPPDWDLLVVDDGSTDRTPHILAELAGRHERLRVVTHPSNRGLGAALRTGFREATGQVVVTMDADLSHPFDVAERLVEACARADAAFASRYVSGGGMEGVPWVRVVISRTGNRLLRLLFGTGVRDLTTGFRAYRTEVVRDLPLRGEGFEIQLELAVRLIAGRRRIVEVPLLLRSRAAGASKMRYLRLLLPYGRAMLGLLPLRWIRR